VRRSTFDPVHDLGQRAGFLLVHQRGEDQMDVVRHYDNSVGEHRRSIVVKAAVQGNRTRVVRQNPALMSAERNKMWLAVSLQVRKLAAVKRLERK
jgi:hypothetical protein